ncbi:cytochrome b/b6 domain-containing protein [Roseateles koreensis]|uniref:Cytochrome b/b6 domain-containing protein n=1 Tax=Roseateles koreensis TaxID=2987526 RepID=A0ABT5KQ66_9BURK|nr:cytochrome b/b6 domain-containing protein [Roseateles koreensis]
MTSVRTGTQTNAEASAEVRVWDRAVRGLHVLLAVSVIAAWATGFRFHPNHHALGYAAATVVALRLAWGFVGSSYARFANFVRDPAATLAYARKLAANRAPHYLGHNPLGGWMVIALLACVGLCSLTGFLYTTDWLWGYAWLDALHRGLAWLLALLLCLHLCGVAMMSWLSRENLVVAMVSGRKKVPARGKQTFSH